MYLGLGIVFLVASFFLLNWARARNGVAKPVLANSEMAGGAAVIAIIVTFSVGVALTIMQFTG